MYAANSCEKLDLEVRSAIDPLQFVTMVGLIRAKRSALGDGIKVPQKCEILPDRARIRRCEAALTMDPTE